MLECVWLSFLHWGQKTVDMEQMLETLGPLGRWKVPDLPKDGLPATQQKYVVMIENCMYIFISAIMCHVLGISTLEMFWATSIC